MARQSAKLQATIEALRDDLARLLELSAEGKLSSGKRKIIGEETRRAISDLTALLDRMDPVKKPKAIFDPSNPNLVGKFIALALVAQERERLADLGRFHGSGVYAVYYRGAFEPYRPIARTETPIYVGKASPARADAQTPAEQGERLGRRLLEHRRNIERASSTLSIRDFDCRTLVVQSGLESAAESYLIHVFKPIWNNETGILFGLGKHGDAAATRGNKRSPWDILHPGRAWAGDKMLADSRSRSRIIADIAKHFETTRVYRSTADVLREFLKEIRGG